MRRLRWKLNTDFDTHRSEIDNTWAGEHSHPLCSNYLDWILTAFSRKLFFQYTALFDEQPSHQKAKCETTLEYLRESDELH